MYTTEKILDLLKEKKPELQKKYPVSELGLFGSYARGDNKEDSDIDILVDFHSRIDGFDYISLAHELEDLFHQKLIWYHAGELSSNICLSLKKT